MATATAALAAADSAATAEDDGEEDMDASASRTARIGTGFTESQAPDHKSGVSLAKKDKEGEEAAEEEGAEEEAVSEEEATETPQEITLQNPKFIITSFIIHLSLPSDTMRLVMIQQQLDKEVKCIIMLQLTQAV